MVQTFEAKDMKDALSAMRASLGEDAVILSSEKTSNGAVLLCAAPGETALPSPKQTCIASFEGRYRERLLARLRGSPEGKAVSAANFSRPDLLARLHAHRMPEALAHALAQAAEESGFDDPALALASALDKRMKVAPIHTEKQQAILIAGPHGAGKTAIAAKLAAEAVLSGGKVILATADAKSAGQRERLETFAVHLGVPVIDVSSPKLFSEAVAAARGEGTLLIADTAGFDLRDPPHEILILTRLGCAETIGVVSSAIDAEEAREIAAGLSNLGVQRLIVTCLDLVRRKGAVATLATSGLALAHATSSPYLVDGLDSLTPPALARALLSPLDGTTPEA